VNAFLEGVSRMFRTLIIPMLAVAGTIFAVVTVVKGSLPPPATAPVIEPARPPYTSFVAGAGLLEASSENIAIGAPVGAIVKKMHVKVGDFVEAGAPLFELDPRELQAELVVREAQLAVAQDQLARLQAGTRSELIPPARARVQEATSSIAAAQAQLDDARAQLERGNQLQEAQVLSMEEIVRRRFAVQQAEARVDQAKAMQSEAQANLALLEAGTWEVDIKVAQSQVAQAKAAVDATRIELDRRIVRSPLSGVVLQRNIREGEFASAGALATPLLLVGDVSALHVRVDVDESEAWRLKAGSKATAFARGNKDISTPLTFVRFEPFVVPKRSLTGSSTERVDTRVLQVIFRFDPKDLPLYVGQQMDVYIESDPIARETNQGGGESVTKQK
jgi:multidrug efflux pump subunit AcrA (membrane-fusion protein)